MALDDITRGWQAWSPTRSPNRTLGSASGSSPSGGYSPLRGQPRVTPLPLSSLPASGINSVPAPLQGRSPKDRGVERLLSYPLSTSLPQNAFSPTQGRSPRDRGVEPLSSHPLSLSLPHNAFSPTSFRSPRERGVEPLSSYPLSSSLPHSAFS